MVQETSHQPETAEVFGCPALSPWARRALAFLEALQQHHRFSMEDLKDPFVLAPSGSLALALHELCHLECLLQLDDTHFRVVPRASSSSSPGPRGPGNRRQAAVPQLSPYDDADLANQSESS